MSSVGDFDYAFLATMVAVLAVLCYSRFKEALNFHENNSHACSKYHLTCTWCSGSSSLSLFSIIMQEGFNIAKISAITLLDILKRFLVPWLWDIWVMRDDPVGTAQHPIYVAAFSAE